MAMEHQQEAVATHFCGEGQGINNRVTPEYCNQQLFQQTVCTPCIGGVKDIPVPPQAPKVLLVHYSKRLMPPPRTIRPSFKPPHPPIRILPSGRQHMGRQR